MSGERWNPVAVRLAGPGCRCGASPPPGARSSSAGAITHAPWADDLDLMERACQGSQRLIARRDQA